MVSRLFAIIVLGAVLNARVRNAGGRTSDLTAEMVKTCQGMVGIETCMHLTCTNMPKEKVDIALRVRIHLADTLTRFPDTRARHTGSQEIRMQERASPQGRPSNGER